MSIAFEDQRGAAMRDLRATVASVADGALAPLDATTLPDRAARELLAILWAFRDGATFFCGHVHPDSPQAVYAATWRGPLVVCDECRIKLLQVPEDLWCIECGASTGRIVAVGVGALLVAIPLCGEHA